MNLKQQMLNVIIQLLIGFFIFACGVFMGITYEGRLDQWRQNLDMSDWISAGIIGMLVIALWLSMTRPRQNNQQY